MKAEFARERDRDSGCFNPTANTTSSTIPVSSSSTCPATNNNNNNSMMMFSSKFAPKFETPIHHPHPQYHHHFQLTTIKDPVQTSEEADSIATPTTTNRTPPTKKQRTTATTNEDGGETVEVIRRPRGRPPGSKNKPKPPVVVTREPAEPSMSPYILEIPPGVDMVESLTRLTRRRGMGLCVLTASGSVANVSLRQPGGVALTFHGRFEMLSLSALLLGAGSEQQQNVNATVNGVFTISLAGPQGQIVGGKVVGPLVAAGTVYVVATSFNNPTYHRLPVDGEDDSGAAGGGGGERQQINSLSSPGGSGSGGEGGIGPPPLALPPPPGMYSGSSCHLGSDVIWAPAAARPPPHQHQRGGGPPHPPPPY